MQAYYFLKFERSDSENTIVVSRNYCERKEASDRGSIVGVIRSAEVTAEGVKFIYLGAQDDKYKETESILLADLRVILDKVLRQNSSGDRIHPKALLSVVKQRGCLESALFRHDVPLSSIPTNFLGIVSKAQWRNTGRSEVIKTDHGIFVIENPPASKEKEIREVGVYGRLIKNNETGEVFLRNTFRRYPMHVPAGFKEIAFNRALEEVKDTKLSGRHPNIAMPLMAVKYRCGDTDVEVEVEYGDWGSLTSCLPHFEPSARSKVAQLIARQMVEGISYRHVVNYRLPVYLTTNDVFLRRDGCVKVGLYDDSRRSILFTQIPKVDDPSLEELPRLIENAPKEVDIRNLLPKHLQEVLPELIKGSVEESLLKDLPILIQGALPEEIRNAMAERYEISCFTPPEYFKEEGILNWPKFYNFDSEGNISEKRVVWSIGVSILSILTGKDFVPPKLFKSRAEVEQAARSGFNVDAHKKKVEVYQKVREEFNDLIKLIRGEKNEDYKTFLSEYPGSEPLIPILRQCLAEDPKNRAQLSKVRLSLNKLPKAGLEFIAGSGKIDDLEGVISFVLEKQKYDKRLDADEEKFLKDTMETVKNTFKLINRDPALIGKYLSELSFARNGKAAEIDVEQYDLKIIFQKLFGKEGGEAKLKRYVDCLEMHIKGYVQAAEKTDWFALTNEMHRNVFINFLEQKIKFSEDLPVARTSRDKLDHMLKNLHSLFNMLFEACISINTQEKFDENIGKASEQMKRLFSILTELKESGISDKNVSEIITSCLKRIVTYTTVSRQYLADYEKSRRRSNNLDDAFKQLIKRSQQAISGLSDVCEVINKSSDTIKCLEGIVYLSKDRSIENTCVWKPLLLLLKVDPSNLRESEFVFLMSNPLDVSYALDFMSRAKNVGSQMSEADKPLYETLKPHEENVMLIVKALSVVKQLRALGVTGEDIFNIAKKESGQFIKSIDNIENFLNGLSSGGKQAFSGFYQKLKSNAPSNKNDFVTFYHFLMSSKLPLDFKCNFMNDLNNHQLDANRAGFFGVTSFSFSETLFKAIKDKKDSLRYDIEALEKLKDENNDLDGIYNTEPAFLVSCILQAYLLDCPREKLELYDLNGEKIVFMPSTCAFGAS